MTTWRYETGPGGASIPVAEITGDREGPAWLLTAGVHGDEYEGPAAIRQVVDHLKSARFAGRVVALPVCNPMAYAAGSRLTPEDQGNLNRSFPGDANGTLTQRWADWLWRKFMCRADHLIDLHAGGVTWEFEPLAGFYRDEDVTLAAVMGFTLWRAPEVAGVLSHEFREKRGPALGCELGFGGVRNDELANRAYIGITDLIEGDRYEAEEPVYFQREVHSESAGEFVGQLRAGQNVAKGQAIGVLTDWTGVSTRAVRSPNDGRLLAIRRLVSVREGELLAVIGLEQKS